MNKELTTKTARHKGFDIRIYRVLVVKKEEPQSLKVTKNLKLGLFSAFVSWW